MVAAPAEALALGFSSGLVCMVSCGTLLLPWLGARGQDFKGTARLMGQFLSGRLAGYLAFAVLAWALGWLLARSPSREHLALGLAQVGLSIVLALDGFSLLRRPSCPVGKKPLWSRLGSWAPLGLGLLTGLNLCPPFLMALLQASKGHHLGHALLFFLCFFLGTAPWLAPFLLVGTFRRSQALVKVARLTTLIMAAYYLFTGTLLLLGSFLHG